MELDAVALTHRPQLVLQFTHFTLHFCLITMLPNSGADQSFARFATTISFVNIHGMAGLAHVCSCLFTLCHYYSTRANFGQIAGAVKFTMKSAKLAALNTRFSQPLKLSPSSNVRLAKYAQPAAMIKLSIY
jgi:hypothetical protein